MSTATSCPRALEGGRRLRADAPQRASELPLVSVVTIVRNGRDELQRTIASVACQTYPCIEHIVVDGASTDGTVELLRQHDVALEYWCSEPDQGVYDAMNKCNRLAAGEYILFLNAGDCLLSQGAVEAVITSGHDAAKPPLLIVGQIAFSIDGELLGWAFPVSEEKVLKYGAPHQATFIHRSVYKTVSYRSFYTVSGDSEYWDRLRSLGLFRPKFVRSKVAAFALGGRSTTPEFEYQRLVEHEISHFLRTRRFRIWPLFFAVGVSGAKATAIRVLGRERYLRYVLANWIRFRFVVLP